MTKPALDELKTELAGAGFLLLGGFPAESITTVPLLSTGSPARTLLLIGSTGPSLWLRLLESTDYRDAKPDPMDRYTKRVLGSIASKNAFEVVFPFEGPPYYPFQQWALKCGGFSQSPLGPLANHEHGPWLGFRAAFLSPASLEEFQDPVGAGGPCETCDEKPCLTACPVSAISSESGYDVNRCQTHLRSGHVACWSGCLARQACPYGLTHQQAPENARFHMQSFLDLL